MPWFLAVLALAACARPAPPASPAQAEAPPPGLEPDAPIPLDPNVRHGALPNGLTWFVEPNPWPEDRVELRLVVKAGSVLEADDQRGAAHFVEHMAFNGTERFPGTTLVNFLESTGMRFGPDLNAYTGFDETVYQLQLPTDDPRMLEQGLMVLGEWAHAVVFDPAEVDAERGVIVEEWRTGQGVGGRLLEATLPLMFHGSRYAERLPIGGEASIRALTREALVRFYEDWYRPELMSVVIVGDVEPAEAQRLIEREFKRLKNPPAAPERVTYDIPIHEQTLALVQVDPEIPMPALQVMEKVAWSWGTTWDSYRESRVDDLFFDMLGQRLGELALKPDAAFLGAGVGKDLRTPTRSFQTLGVSPRQGQEVQALEAAMTEVRRAREHGFTEAELDRAMRRHARGMETYFQERERTVSEVAAEEILRHILFREPMPGTTWEYEAFEHILPTITLDDVNRVADRFLDGGGRVVVAALPPNGAPPTEADLLAALARAESAPVEPWADDGAEAVLVSEAPAPGDIVRTERIAEIDATVWTLSNGVRVLLKPTTFASDEIRFAAWSWGGTSTATDAEYPSAALSTAIAERSGLGDLSLTALSHALAGSEVAVSPYVTELTEGVLGGTAPADLDAALQLVWLTFQRPRFDPEAFEVELRGQEEVLRNRTVDPGAVFEDAVDALLYGGHPRRRSWTVDDLKAVDLATAERFYRERFGDADDFTFIFVGNFTPELLEGPVKTWLATLPTRPASDTWRDVGARPIQGPAARVVRAGRDPVAVVRLEMHGDAPFDRVEAHHLEVVGELLQTRLQEELREELGGTYGVATDTTMFRYPWSGYRVLAEFQTDPARVDELRRAVHGGIEDLRERQVSPMWLATYVGQERRTWETASRDNSAWLGWLLEYEQAGWPLAGIPRLDALLATDTPEAIQAAARRYLEPDRAIEVVLLPESAGSETGALTRPPR